MSDKTYTEEELAAAVAAATKPLEDRVNALISEKADEETEAKIAEVKAEADAKVAEAESARDLAVAEAQAAKVELENVNAYLTAEVEREEEEKAKADRLEARVASVKENANYTDDFVEANKARWAEMADADFDTFIDGLKAIGVKKEEIPGSTGLTASRETAGGSDESALGGFLAVRRAGHDIRKLAAAS